MKCIFSIILNKAFCSYRDNVLLISHSTWNNKLIFFALKNGIFLVFQKRRHRAKLEIDVSHEPVKISSYFLFHFVLNGIIFKMNTKYVYFYIKQILAAATYYDRELTLIQHYNIALIKEIIILRFKLFGITRHKQKRCYLI